MSHETRIGRWLFAAACIGFGVEGLVFTKFIGGLEPRLSTLLPAPQFAWIHGGMMIVLGASLLWDRTVRSGALGLAAVFLAATVVLQTPLMIGHPKEAADDFFHVLAIGSGALALAAAFGGPWAWSKRVGMAARLAFGVCTIGHGVMHFVYFKITTDFIPAWIPGHEFWAAATGVAQIAAGLAILSGVQGWLAAVLTGAMYASWFPIVHIPRVMADPASIQEWNSLPIVAALAASALLVAGLFPLPRRA
ncbi:MAG: DoxX family membrane protein [Phenylobacterium sp.]